MINQFIDFRAIEIAREIRKQRKTKPLPRMRERNKALQMERQRKLREENLAQRELINSKRTEDPLADLLKGIARGDISRNGLTKTMKDLLASGSYHETKLQLVRRLFRSKETIRISDLSDQQFKMLEVILAIPVWADLTKIQDMYLERDAANENNLGIQYEIDHIVPLRSKLVCGLHTHENLRVTTQEENRGKRSKIIEELLGMS